MSINIPHVVYRAQFLEVKHGMAADDGWSYSFTVSMIQDRHALLQRIALTDPGTKYEVGTPELVLVSPGFAKEIHTLGGIYTTVATQASPDKDLGLFKGQ